MNIKNQKRIAKQVLKAGKYRVRLDPSRLKDIKEAITKADIRGLIIDDIIQLKKKKGISGFRARHIKKQKSKGRRKGLGSRKGTPSSRLSRKSRWINKVRVQRAFLKELKDKKFLSKKDFREIYGKIKGGIFRSKRHLKLYLVESKLLKK